jgi:hypothetical protein
VSRPEDTTSRDGRLPKTAIDGVTQTSKPDGEPSGSPAVRAQLLATEHWSLLAARGLTWSEVMSRITLHLTVTSAALVVLALATPASRFGTPFFVLAIGLTSAILVLGTLTGVRVHNASIDDAVMIAGMNRLRAAYLELVPSLADYFVTSPHDDLAGVTQTYTMGAPRSVTSHVVGSTSMFINIVNAITAGTLGALVGAAAGGSTLVISVVGVASGLLYLSVVMEVGRRSFKQLAIPSRFPSPEGGSIPRGPSIT